MIDRFVWVAGSPSASENPPHDAAWRATIAAELPATKPGVSEVSLDFVMEPYRMRIDLDNLVRCAISGLRDANVLAWGHVGLDMIVATKRSGKHIGLGINTRRGGEPLDEDPFGATKEFLLEDDVIPRASEYAQKEAARARMVELWRDPPGTHDVGVDITLRTRFSLSEHLKPLIDILEPYLGRGGPGRGEFRPRDERIVWLRVRRDTTAPHALRIVAGPPPKGALGRWIPPVPRLLAMDPGFTFSMSDLEAIERDRAWYRLYGSW